MSSKTSIAVLSLLTIFVATNAAKDEEKSRDPVANSDPVPNRADISPWPENPNDFHDWPNLKALILGFLYTRGGDYHLATWKYLHLELADTYERPIQSRRRWCPVINDWKWAEDRLVFGGEEKEFLDKSYNEARYLFNRTYIHPDDKQIPWKNRRFKWFDKKRHEFGKYERVPEIGEGTIEKIKAKINAPWSDWGRQRENAVRISDHGPIFKGDGHTPKFVGIPGTIHPKTPLGWDRESNYFVISLDKRCRVIIRLIDLFNGFQAQTKCFEKVKTIKCGAVVEIRGGPANVRNLKTSVKLTISNDEFEYLHYREIEEVN